VHCGACAVLSDKIKLWVSNTVLLTVFALHKIFIFSVDALLILLTRCRRNMLTAMGKMRAYWGGRAFAGCQCDKK